MIKMKAKDVPILGMYCHTLTTSKRLLRIGTPYWPQLKSYDVLCIDLADGTLLHSNKDSEVYLLEEGDL